MPRRLLLGVLVALLAAVVYPGCGQQPQVRLGAPDSEPPGKAKPGPGAGQTDTAPGVIPAGVTAGALDLVPVPAPEQGKQEKYDAALFDALNLAADGKFSDALAALESARAIQETD